MGSRRTDGTASLLEMLLSGYERSSLRDRFGRQRETGCGTTRIRVNVVGRGVEGSTSFNFSK